MYIPFDKKKPQKTEIVSHPLKNRHETLYKRQSQVNRKLLENHR